MDEGDQVKVRAVVVRLLPATVGLACMFIYDWTTSGYQLGWMLLIGAGGFVATRAGIGLFRQRRATPGS